MRFDVRALRALPVLAALLPAACGIQFSSAALGNYAATEPFARMQGTLTTVELRQPAHVAVVGIRTPRPGYDEAPVLFSAIYPYSEQDPTHFGAGRHRLSRRPHSPRMYRECRDAEPPTLAGCRRRILPGVRTLNIGEVYPQDTHHYLVITADEPVDPYALADALFFAGLEHGDFTEAIKRRDAEAAADTFERVLLDLRLPTAWAGLYVTNR